MTYTWKAFLMVFLVSISVDTHENITCEELMENIIYEGVFFGGLDEHNLNSPFLNDVTAYIYNEEIYVVSTDSRDRTSVYCNVDKEDWEAFEANCSCSYSKKFDDHIRKHSCNCSID